MSTALRRLPIRQVYTSTSSSSTLHLTLPTTSVSPSISPSTQQALNLDDHERLFASVPTRSLVATLANLYMTSAGPAVDLGSAVVRRVMEGDWGLARRTVSAVLKGTVYAHFCAGETAEEAAQTLRAMWDGGLRGILDYGLEDAHEDEECDRNLQAFLSTVETTNKLPQHSVSFACVKITAVCPISLLEKVSLLLRYHHQNPHHDLPWLFPSLSVLPATSTTSTATANQVPAPPPLSPSDQRRLQAALTRLSTLCSACEELDLPLLVDAEYSSVQPAIDHLTYAAMLRFNNRRTDRPLVYGTVQAYLRDSLERLATAVGEAERRGVPVGFKLVRGAYISRERREAEAQGLESPVHSSIEETHESYDRCAAFLLEKVATGSAATVLATHNVDSGRKAAAKVEELGIDKRDMRVEFAQLKGMAEALSLGLKNSGFNVSKYLAFGPVEKVMPYLLRRAEENKGVLSASTHDRTLIRKEIVKRVQLAVLGG